MGHTHVKLTMYINGDVRTDRCERLYTIMCAHFNTYRIQSFKDHFIQFGSSHLTTFEGKSLFPHAFFHGRHKRRIDIVHQWLATSLYSCDLMSVYA